MPRKREGSIRESIEELNDLSARQQGESGRARVRMLLLMKEDPSRTLVQVAGAIDCAEKTVRRWLKIYQEDGLEGLLSEKKPIERPAPAEAPLTGKETTIPGHICDFLNGLPQSNDTVEWIGAFREIFRQLFHDLDWISINVNINARPESHEGSDSSTYVTQHVSSGSNVPFHMTTTVDNSGGSPGERLVENATRQGFPAEKYHRPHVSDYYTERNLYLGSIIFWREKGRKPISPRTLRSIEKLKPFLTFMLTDCIARRRQADPGLSIFTDTVERVAEKEKLTQRQREVLVHQLLGKTYAQTAAALNIAVDTVRSHVKAIHAKTGTGALVELFARHFSPLQAPEGERRK